jgi:hypothetical protein
MTERPWRYAFASVVGASHERGGLPCQDASVCAVLSAADGNPALVVVAADGAGSASHGDEGARLACAHLLEEVAAWLGAGGTVADLTREHAGEWLSRFQDRVLNRAAAGDGLGPRDFACTVLAAIVGPGRAAFLQVGDGVIIVSARDEPAEYAWVFWPRRGEYANTTYFATDPSAHEHLDFALVDACIDEVAVLTDGVEPLALHYDTRTAHGPFFRPVFAAVQAAPPGLSVELSAALATFLGSPRVAARSDDDRTLVLATRRGTGVDSTTDDRVTADTVDAGAV